MASQILTASSKVNELDLERQVFIHSLSVGNKEHRTKTIQGTLNPKYDETISLMIEKDDKKIVKINGEDLFWNMFLCLTFKISYGLECVVSC